MDTARQTRSVAGVDMRSAARLARTTGCDGTNLTTGWSGARLIMGTALARFILAEREICRAEVALEKYCPFLASVERPASARSSKRMAPLPRYSFIEWGSSGRLLAWGSRFICDDGEKSTWGKSESISKGHFLS